MARSALAPPPRSRCAPARVAAAPPGPPREPQGVVGNARPATASLLPISASDVRLRAMLSLAPTLPRRSLVASTDRGGQRFFQIRDVERELTRADHPDSVRMYLGYVAVASRRSHRRRDRLLGATATSRPHGFTVTVAFSSGGAHHTQSNRRRSDASHAENIEYRARTSSQCSTIR